MAHQEEKTQKFCSSVNSGIAIPSINRSNSKKQKQKKVPQRGLGVAQLEKIRLQEEEEELQQNNKKHHRAGVVSPCSSSSSVTTVISPNKSQFPSLPMSPTIANAIFRPPPLLVQNSVDGIFQDGLGLAGHHEIVPKSHCFGDVDHGIAYRNNIIGLVQRLQQPCSSLVNLSSTSLTSSELISQMELPSNQSFGSNYIPLRTADEKKMVSLKRQYPFSQDDPPGLTINYKIPTVVRPGSRSDESTFSGNGGTNFLEPHHHVVREGSLSPSMSKSNSKQSFKDKGSSNGDFLTLSPPATRIKCPNTYFKHPPDCFPLYNVLPDVKQLPFRGAIEDLNLQLAPSGSNQQQSYNSFLPPPQGQCCQKTTTKNNHNVTEEGGTLDLNLKL